MKTIKYSGQFKKDFKKYRNDKAKQASGRGTTWRLCSVCYGGILRNRGGYFPYLGRALLYAV